MAESKIRRLARLAKSAAASSDEPDFAELFQQVLHPQEHAIFAAVMASIETKAPAATALHRMDAAIAVASGLVMCRLMDSGQYGELEKVSPAWNRHAKPLIAAINERTFRGKSKKNSQVLDLFSDILADDTDTLPAGQEASVDLI